MFLACFGLLFFFLLLFFGLRLLAGPSWLVILLIIVSGEEEGDDRFVGTTHSLLNTYLNRTKHGWRVGHTRREYARPLCLRVGYGVSVNPATSRPRRQNFLHRTCCDADDRCRCPCPHDGAESRERCCGKANNDRSTLWWCLLHAGAHSFLSRARPFVIRSLCVAPSSVVYESCSVRSLFPSWEETYVPASSREEKKTENAIKKEGSSS